MDGGRPDLGWAGWLGGRGDSEHGWGGEGRSSGGGDGHEATETLVGWRRSSSVGGVSGGSGILHCPVWSLMLEYNLYGQ